MFFFAVKTNISLFDLVPIDLLTAMPDQMNKQSQQVDRTRQLAKRGRQEVPNDDLSDDINSEIKNMLQTLSQKMDTMSDTMSGNDTRLNAKIDSLESTMTSKVQAVKDELVTRIQTVSDEFDQRLEQAEMSTISKCDEIYSNLNKTAVRVDELKAYHESRLDRLERFSLEKDLIISGVPIENNDDPCAILGDICGALNCKLKQGDFAAVFRLTSSHAKSKNTRMLPIVARLYDDWGKNELLSNYFRKKNLNLADIGFKTSTRIFINERLTTTNREIFNRAAQAKKSNFIHRFFTRRGLVYVQRDENSRPVRIFHSSELEFADSLNHTRHQYRNAQGSHSFRISLTNSEHPKHNPAVNTQAQPSFNNVTTSQPMDTQINSAEPQASTQEETLQNLPSNGNNIS